jgi:hypothetical protein
LEPGDSHGYAAGTCAFPSDYGAAASASAESTEVEELDLNDQNLVGDIPNLCEVFPKLKYLWLNNNPNLNAGSVPSWLAECTELQEVGLSNTNRIGDLVEAVDLFLPLNQTVVHLHLEHNPFTAGPVPPSIQYFINLVSLGLSATNRIGMLGTVNFPPSLGELYINDNPRLAEGPVPKSFAKLSALRFVKIADSSRYGPVDVDICGLNISRGEPCECTNQYTGDRCQTCKACGLDGLDCSEVAPEQRNCVIPPDVASAFFDGTTPVTELSWGFGVPSKLVGMVPNLCAAFPELEILVLDGNRGLDAGPVFEWLGECIGLVHLNLTDTNRRGDMATAIDVIASSSATLAFLTLARNENFDRGPVPPRLAEFAGLETVSLESTNRNGAMSGVIDAFVSSAGTLMSLSLDGNTEFTAGPVPITIALPKLNHFSVVNTNRYGTFTEHGNACAVASIAGYPCTCTDAYTGDRCTVLVFRLFRFVL